MRMVWMMTLHNIIKNDKWLIVFPYDKSFIFYDLLNAYFERNNITTKNEILFFLAQASRESDGFKQLVENFNYKPERAYQVFKNKFKDFEECTLYCKDPIKLASKVYANRFGNKNEESQDGWKFIGRGLFQITFRDNYQTCGLALNLPLTKQPDLLKLPLNAVKSAIWYWQSRGLDKLSLENDFFSITKKITGSINDNEARLKIYEKLKSFTE